MSELQTLKAEHAEELGSLRSNHNALKESYDQLRLLLDVTVPGTSVSVQSEIRYGRH